MFDNATEISFTHNLNIYFCSRLIFLFFLFLIKKHFKIQYLSYSQTDLKVKIGLVTKEDTSDKFSRNLGGKCLRRKMINLKC